MVVRDRVFRDRRAKAMEFYGVWKPTTPRPTGPPANRCTTSCEQHATAEAHQHRDHESPTIRALTTGATGGIGNATTVLLAQPSAHVLVGGRLAS